MSYVLATTEDKVRWYKDKATAKDAAKALGLKTWRYVKI